MASSVQFMPMKDVYQPASDFLKAIIADEIPLCGNEFARANLSRLIDLTRDQDRSNRDWAAMLLAQTDIDTEEVRQALLASARDDDDVVRAEAILGLAQRMPSLALPFVKEELSGAVACMALFEAAILIADVSLINPLKQWIEPSENEFLDRLAIEALEACERAATRR
jgi:HEAT repeats